MRTLKCNPDRGGISRLKNLDFRRKRAYYKSVENPFAYPHESDSKMKKIKALNEIMKRLADRMIGQDVERHNNVENFRAGGDFAAVSQIHHSQGITPLGFGR